MTRNLRDGPYPLRRWWEPDDRPGFEPCSEQGHAFGCPCHAGGDVELAAPDALTLCNACDTNAADPASAAGYCRDCDPDGQRDAERRQARDLDR